MYPIRLPLSVQGLDSHNNMYTVRLYTLPRDCIRIANVPLIIRFEKWNDATITP